MSTDSIAEWPDDWNGHGIGWAVPFPAMVQLRNPHHSANISSSKVRDDSTWKRLTPDQRESLEGWLFDESIADR